MPVRPRPKAAGLLAAVALVIAPVETRAGMRADATARALESDPVYVHPAIEGRLPPPDRGRIRIVEEAIGRIRIAVVPEALARDEGGTEELAKSIDRTLQPRGALIVVAGPAFHVITSHPRAEATVTALRAAVTRTEEKGLAAQLLAAVPAVARVDPGAGQDLRGPEGDGGTDVPVPQAEDFLDDIGDVFRLGVLIVAAAIALPFVLVALYLVLRMRRRATHEEEVLESGEQAVRSALNGLGEGIRALDLDTSCRVQAAPVWPPMNRRWRATTRRTPCWSVIPRRTRWTRPAWRSRRASARSRRPAAC